MQAFALAALLAQVTALAPADPPLVRAARAGEWALLAELIREGAAIDLAGADLGTALLWAAHHDDEDAVGLLLGANADPDRANDLGATPLWAASQNGSEAIVGRLLGAGADPNRALLSGETPLMVAARSGYPRVVAPLLAGGADPDARATRGQTALMWAVAEQHPDVVEILLEGGADIHARSEVWELVMAVPPHGYRDYNRAIPHGGNTALMFAAQVGDLDSARLLVAAGADVDDSDAWGVSALAMAGHSGFRDLALFLLANGADPDAAGPGFTAMHTAIMRRDAPLAAALLERGADPNLPVGTWTPTRRTSDDFHFSPELVGATPYWLAARFGEPRLMELLLAHGADPRIVHRGEYVLESITGDGLASRANTTTALMAALEMGRGSAWVAPDRGSAEARTMAAVRIALEAGVDVNVEDTDGRRALDAAMRLAYDGLPGLLAEHGALAGETASAAPRSPRP